MSSSAFGATFQQAPCSSVRVRASKLVEMEVRELLDQCDHPGDDILIVRGSALAAAEGKNDELGKDAVLALMAAVNVEIAEPERVLDKPFLMSVEDIFSIAGRGAGSWTQQGCRCENQLRC
jgi:translation elongation factor EF-Tu-like GTPase